MMVSQLAQSHTDFPMTTIFCKQDIKVVYLKINSDNQWCGTSEVLFDDRYVRQFQEKNVKNLTYLPVLLVTVYDLVTTSSCLSIGQFVHLRLFIGSHSCQSLQMSAQRKCTRKFIARNFISLKYCSSIQIYSYYHSIFKLLRAPDNNTDVLYTACKLANHHPTFCIISVHCSASSCVALCFK